MKKLYLIMMSILASVVLQGNDFNMLEKLCREGNTKACATYGEAALKYMINNPNNKEMLTILNIGAELVPKGYVNLGIMYEEGIGVTKNNEKAISYYKKACDKKEYSGCNNLGILFWNEGQLSKAIKLFHKGCYNDHANSCHNLATMYEIGYGVDIDKNKARVIYDKACKLGDKKSCKKRNILQKYK